MDSGNQKSFSFTPAASLWASFKYIAALIYGLSYIAALPVQLLLHRRIGERYLNSVVLLVAVVVGIMLVVFGQGASFLVGRSFAAPRAWDSLAAALSIFAMMFVVPAFSLLHRYGSWRRERSGDIVHSRSWGVPFYLFKRADDGKAASIHPAAMPAVNAKAPPLHLIAEVWSEFLQGWRQMLIERSQGIVPQGWVPWLVVTVFQPTAFVLLGVVLLFVHIGFGITLLLAGVGMFVQGRVAAAFFREQILDHRDSKIEQDAWVQIVQGKPAIGEQHGYAVPIASQALTQAVRDSIAARLIKADPAYALILKPVQVIEGKQPGTAGVGRSEAH